MSTSDSAHVKPVDALTAEVMKKSLWRTWAPLPIVAEGPCLEATRTNGEMPHAEMWGFPHPADAIDREMKAEAGKYCDGLHYLAAHIANFTTAVVSHHLAPSEDTARYVRSYGIRAASVIMAMVRDLTRQKLEKVGSGSEVSSVGELPNGEHTP